MSGDLFFDLDGHGEPTLWRRGNPPTALDARETAKAAGTLLAEVAALRAERDRLAETLADCERANDSERDELDGLRQRVEAGLALCDEVERQTRPPYGFNLRHTDVRAALAADSPEPEASEAPGQRLPTLDGITDELAEHSATLDHALDRRADGTWFCATCADAGVMRRERERRRPEASGATTDGAGE